MSSLKISSYSGEPLQNRLLLARENNDRIAIMFPGRGYSCAMPLLYYATEALVAFGYDVLHVEYRYDAADFPEPQGEQWRQAVRHDVEAVYAAVAGEQHYTSRLLVGKSLGSIAIALLLEAHAELATADCIWLTPLVGIEQIRRILGAHTGRSLVVIGSEDPHYDSAIFSEIESSRAEVVVIDGADHSLQIPDDLPRSIDALKTTTLSIERFL